MQKKKYIYDYPEQREVSKGLRLGDALIIAEKTNNSPEMVRYMISGKRKMKEEVKILIEQLILINKQIEDIQVSQREIKE